MAKIKFRETVFIRQIIALYEKGRPQQEMDVSKSIVFNEGLQGWFYTLGITDKECFVDGLDYPKAGGLSDLCRSNVGKNPEQRRNCEFFNFVYNTCYQYITDNQTRYFGRADLADISHGKVFAMILIAHLCQAAMELPKEEQAIYRQRIHNFVTELLGNQDILKSGSLDIEMLSCKTALDNICNAHERQPAQEKDAIEQLFNEVENTIGTMSGILQKVDQYTLAIVTGQTGVTGDQLHGYYANAEHTVLTTKQQDLINGRLVTELYRKPYEAFKDKEGYKKLYYRQDKEHPDALTYNLEVVAEDSFLLRHFDEGQRANFVNLLKLRDRLGVLQAELQTLYELTQTNQLAFLNDFLYLADPYLKEIHRVKGELQACVERFDADTSKVYRTRQEDTSWFQAERREWESIYYNKTFLGRLRQGIANLAHNIASTFSKIPFDRYNALEARNVKAADVVARGEALFGIDFSKEKSHFQESISKAQQSELNRQAELILLKQQDISEEYAHLILKAKASSDPQVELIELLQRRKKVVDDMIMAMIQQSREVEKSKIVDEDDFVIIEHSAVTLGMMEVEHQSGGFFQLVRNYLASSPAAIEALKKELDAVKAELEETKKTVVARDKQIKDLKQDVEQRDTRVSALQQRLELTTGITHSLLLNSTNGKLVKSITVAVSKEEGLVLPEVKKLHNVLVNFSNVIEQGLNYEKAYAKYASRFDLSRFFSHNDNGKKHAQLVMKDWEMHLRNMLNHHVETALSQNNNKIDEVFIANLADRLMQEIGHSIDGLVVDDNYSSYKQHSYRNYTYHFHQQMVQNHRSKLDLTQEPVAIVGVDEVEAVVVDTAFIGYQGLSQFSKGLVTVPRPEKEAEHAQTSSWLSRIF